MNPGDKVQIVNPKSSYHMETGEVVRYTAHGDIIVKMDMALAPAYTKMPFSPWDIQPVGDTEE